MEAPLFPWVNLYTKHHFIHHFTSLCIRINFRGYSKLLAEETSRNHQAFSKTKTERAVHFLVYFFAVITQHCQF